MSHVSNIKPVSAADLDWGFRMATRGLVRKFAERLSEGWSDETLESELHLCFGISGGMSRPGHPHISYQGSGLKLWVTWEANTYNVKPTWQGKRTIAKARAIYNIPDPENRQLDLF